MVITITNTEIVNLQVVKALILGGAAVSALNRYAIPSLSLTRIDLYLF